MSEPRCRSGQSRAMWPALPQTRQMMLAVKFRCSGQSVLPVTDLTTCKGQHNSRQSQEQPHSFDTPGSRHLEGYR